MDKLILQVRENKKTKQKSITIPKDYPKIKKDDYVEVKKI
jgi:hypothetical protein